MTVATPANGNGAAVYPGFSAYAPDMPTATLADYGDKFVSLLGRYYSRVQLIPFIPDIYTVAYTQSALVRSQGLRVLDQMRLDDMVQAGVGSWVGNVLTGGRFQPADVTDAAEHKLAKGIADFYTSQFERIPGGFLASLADELEGAATYGHAVSTLPLKVWDDGAWRGYTATADIKWLMPHFLAPLHDSVYGSVEGWAQVDRQSGTSVLFDEGDVLHFVLGTTKDPARGRSLLLPAHIHWITKTLLMRLRNHNAEWAVGRLMLQQTVKPEDGGLSKAEFDAFCLDWINHYIERWGIPLPYGVTATLVNSNQITPDVFNAVLRHADQGILRSIGIDWMLQEEPEYGNRALGEVKSGQGNNKFKLIRDNFSAICQSRLVDRTAKLNGWPQRLWPRFTMQPAIEDDKIEVVQQAAALQSGNLISKQPQDENWYRERLGMALVKEGAVEAAPTAPQPQAPAVPQAGPTDTVDASAVGDIRQELESKHPAWPKDQVTAVMLKKARERGIEAAEAFSEPSPRARLMSRLAAIVEKHL